jgi:WXG100 family type VII secretion target
MNDIQQGARSMAEKIQADYEQLSELSSKVGQFADEVQEMNAKLLSQAEVLAESWVGESASRFQQEMEDLVLPGVKRLFEGLDMARETVGAFSPHFKSAEDEATGLLPAQ